MWILIVTKTDMNLLESTVCYGPYPCQQAAEDAFNEFHECNMEYGMFRSSVEPLLAPQSFADRALYGA